MVFRAPGNPGPLGNQFLVWEERRQKEVLKKGYCSGERKKKEGREGRKGNSRRKKGRREEKCVVLSGQGGLGTTSQGHRL